MKGRARVCGILVAALLAAGCGRAGQAPAATGSPAGGAIVPELTWVGPAASWQSDQLEANRMIIAAWQQLGLKVNMITAPDYAAFVGTLAGKPWQVASAGYIGRLDRVEPAELMGLPFLCRFGTTAKGPNFGAYCNPAYDKVALAMNATFDQAQRQKLAWQGQEILARDLPFIAQYYPWDTDVHTKRFQTVSAVGGGLYNFWDFVDAQPTTSDQVFRFGSLGDFSLNPYTDASNTYNVEIQRLIYDTLTKMDTQGKVVPWAAESWTVSPDGKTLTARLRSGMQFTDGTPVTAADVKFSFDSFKEHKVPLFLSELNNLSSVDASGDSVVFHLSSPDATFLDRAMANVPLLPQHIWQSVADPVNATSLNLTGSGPYRFVSHTPNVRIVLTRNGSHFHPGKPSGFEAVIFANAESMLLAMQKDQIDIEEPGEMTTALLERAKTFPNVVVDLKPGITVRWMAFNLRQGSPFADYWLRLAVTHTLDYKSIIQAVLNGQGDPGEGIIAPANQFWHDPQVSFPQYDTKLARQILQEHGYTWDASGRLHYPASYKPQLLAPANG